MPKAVMSESPNHSDPADSRDDQPDELDAGDGRTLFGMGGAPARTPTPPARETLEDDDPEDRAGRAPDSEAATIFAMDTDGGAPSNFSEAPTQPAADASARLSISTNHSRYRATREVGRGGMGRVLLAIDDQFDREVAIKELLPAKKAKRGASPFTPLGKPSETVERFLRKARVTGKLEHPGIIPVYEIGERADGSAFYDDEVHSRRIDGRQAARD